METLSLRSMVDIGDLWLSYVRRWISDESSVARPVCDPVVAYHEAGHAVVAYLLGRSCRWATVRRQGPVLGRVALPRYPVVPIDPRMAPQRRLAFEKQLRRNMMNAALINLAGVAAEVIWSNHDLDELSTMNMSGCEPDLWSAEYHLKLLWHFLTEGQGRLGGRTNTRALIQGIRTAHALLAANRAALDAVATRLMRWETLQGKSLERTIRRTAAAPHKARELEPGWLFGPF